MNNRLYVGGISYNTNEEALRGAFSQAGNVVSASIIMDRMSGRSKGFGFVEMESEEEAQKAIEMWNGKVLDERTLTVNLARPKEERPGGGGGGFNRGGGRGFGGGGGRDSRGGFGGSRGRDDRRGGGHRSAGRDFHGLRRGSR